MSSQFEGRETGEARAHTSKLQGSQLGIWALLHHPLAGSTYPTTELPTLRTCIAVRKTALLANACILTRRKLLAHSAVVAPKRQ